MYEQIFSKLGTKRTQLVVRQRHLPSKTPKPSIPSRNLTQSHQTDSKQPDSCFSGLSEPRSPTTLTLLELGYTVILQVEAVEQLAVCVPGEEEYLQIFPRRGLGVLQSQQT